LQMHAADKLSLRWILQTFELGFLDEALKEWRKLDNGIREQFKAKLAERLIHPHVSASKLSGAKNRYKIKLLSIGYRLVYEVRDSEFIVIVVAVGKRDRNAVYKMAELR
jgi:mRNA interferase RelE/StbE